MTRPSANSSFRLSAAIGILLLLVLVGGALNISGWLIPRIRPQVRQAGVIQSIDRKALEKSQFAGPFLLLVQKGSGTFYYAQVENAVVENDTFVGNAELSFGDGEHGIVSDGATTIDSFHSKREEVGPVAVFARTVSRVVLPDGSVLPVKVLRGRISRGRLVGDFTLFSLKDKKEITGTFDARGELSGLQLQDSLKVVDPAEELIFRETLQLFAEETGEPERSILGMIEAIIDQESWLVKKAYAQAPVLSGLSLPAGNVGSFVNVQRDATNGALVVTPQAGAAVAAVSGIGPPGPTGPSGPAGPAGAKGDKGDTGSAGATGATGATGSAGSGGTGDIEGVTAGSGLSGGGTTGTVSLDVNLTTSGTTGSTSSNSGLEVSASGLALLKGCADNELLKWTDAGGWACASDTSGGSLTVRESDTSPSVSPASTIEFGPAASSTNEFIVSDQGGGTGRVRIGNQVGLLNEAETVTGGWTFNTLGTIFTTSAALNGGLSTGGTSRLTSGGALENITGLAVSSGTVSLPAGEIDNSELANSSLTITAGSGLINGGSVSLGGSTTLNIGAGNGITVNADDVTIDLTAATNALSATTSSGSGLEVLASGLTLLQGCSDAQVLKWNETTDTWDCSADTTGGSLTVRESDTSPSVSPASTIEFGPAATSTDEFIVSDQGGSTSRVRIGNQVGLLNEAETVTGGWTFNTAATTFTTAIDVNTTSTIAGLTVDGGTLTLSGLTTDITTGTNESLVIVANGSGTIDIQDATTVDSLTTDTGGITIAAGQGIGNGTWSINSAGLGTSLTANDLSCTNCIGSTEIADLTLGTDTTGNYVASVTNGTGISGGDGGSETAGLTLSVNQDSAFAWTNAHTYTFAGTENLGITSNLAGTVNVVAITGTPSGTAGATSGLTITQADSANTNGLDSGLVIANADTDLPIGAALNITDAGGGFTTIINNAGTLISGTELNRLDGKDASLVDTNDAVTTAITGTGALDSGSITTNFGSINVGTDSISTTGTVTAGTLSVNAENFTDLTGNGLTISSGALTVNVAASADALSATTSSGSGLEVLSSGLALLQGCSDSQILKWNETTDTWGCAADTTGGSLTVRESDTSPSVSPASTIEFGPAATSTDEFIVSDQGSSTARVRIGNQVGLLNEAETVTGGWTFNTAATTFTTAIDVNASSTIAGLTIDGGTLTLSGLATDITTGTNESLVIVANGAGTVDIQDATTVDSLTTDTGGISIAAGQNIGNGTWSIDSTGLGTSLTANDLSCTNCIGPTEISDLTLGTDTAGNYVASITNGTGISGADGGSETAGLTLSVNQDTAFAWTNSHTYTFAGTENLGLSSDLVGTVNVVSITGTPSGTAGTTSGLTITQADSANTNGLDSGLVIANADTNLPLGAAIKFTDAGGGFTALFDNAGTLISGAELNRLDGKDAALVDTNDAVTTAITGTGALDSGSITANFGSINVGTDTISTTGTITAGTLSVNSENFTDLTGNGLTISSGALTVNVAASADALSSTTSSGSGLEVLSSGLTLLQGCSDTQILKWNETTDTWGCAADQAGGGTATLQVAYDNGNTILTTTARNIAFTLGEVATPTSLTLENQDTAGTSAQRIFNSIASGTLTNGLLIEQTGAGTMTSGLQIAETAGTITDGILITGTLGNILNSGSIDITGAGAITGATGLTLASGTLSLTSTSGAINSTGLTGLTQTLSSGTAAITAPTINFNTAGTGNTAVGNATGTFALTSSGGLNVTTGGALTGVASLDTIGVSATAFSFAGAGSVTSNTTNALTLDSGTTGAVNLGTGANAKTLTIGNITGATAVNINSGTGNVNFTVGPTSSSGKVQIGNSATATPDLLVLDNGTADPTGVNGGMYYNTSTNKYRCYENGAWVNCVTTLADVQSAASYDTSDALDNVAAGEVTLASVSVTPSTATGDVYVRGKVELVSSNNTDQSLVIKIEDNATCTGSVLATNTIAITVANGVIVGDFELVALEADAGTAAQNYSFCASTATGDTDVRIFGMFATVIDNGSDLAEFYTTNDSTLSAGDVVSLDSNLETGAQKSAIAYDPGVLGIVSTWPGLVMGNVTNEGVKAVPIAMSGRVPVKVSSENGPIKAGDYLTTSSLAGVAMKATKAGAVIGTALTDFNGEGTGAVLAFVKNGAATGTLSNLLPGLTENETDYGRQVLTQLLSQPLATGEPADFSNVLADRVAAGIEVIAPRITAQDARLTGTLELLGENGLENVRVDSLGNAFFAGTLKADKIEANQIQGWSILANNLSSLTEKVDGLASNSAQVASSETAGGSPTLLADLLNGLFRRVSEFFDQVVFHGDVAFLGRPTFNKDTAGFAFLPSGASEVEVRFEKEYASHPVVTANVNLVGTTKPDEVPAYAIADLTTKGFKIRLSRPSSFDLNFSWMALSVANSTTPATVTKIDHPAEPTPVIEPTSQPSPVPTVEPASTPTPEPTAVPVTPIPSPLPTPSPEITPEPSPTASNSAQVN